MFMSSSAGSSAIASMTGFASADAPDDISPFLYREAVEQPTTGRVGFTIFLLATAALLLRPSDMFLTLQDIPIYQTLVVACLGVSVSRLIHHLSAASPANAITRLILGVLAAAIVSQLVRGSLYDVRTGGFEFFKIVVYYLLILAWVDSPRRMRQYLLCLCACFLILTVLALMQFDGWINFAGLRSVVQKDIDPASGAVLQLRRLAGAGIVSDPNDLCLLLVTAMVLCYSFIGHAPWGRLRFGWLIPLGLFGYAVTLTSSRGGFLSLLGAGAAILIARYGRARAVMAAAVLLPIMILVFAGRQTRVDLSSPEDTFQTRLDHWSDSLTFFEGSPLFGIGQEQQEERTGYVAHNSFIQSYAELGFVGGACFLGAFILAINGVRRTTVRESDPQLARLRPYILGIVAGYGIGLLALSRAYTVPTYLALGIAAAYINLTPRAVPLRLDKRFIQRLAGISVLFIVAIYLFVRTMSV
jgi:putative inorganic carbon (hco3(-)) transporter